MNDSDLQLVAQKHESVCIGPCVHNICQSHHIKFRYLRFFKIFSSNKNRTFVIQEKKSTMQKQSAINTDSLKHKNHQNWKYNYPSRGQKTDYITSLLSQTLQKNIPTKMWVVRLRLWQIDVQCFTTFKLVFNIFLLA